MFRLVETLRPFLTLLCFSQTVRRDLMTQYECCCSVRTTGLVRGFGYCFLWTERCTVDSVLKLFGSVSSLVQLATYASCCG
jgi:hypothetical protein